MLAFSAPGPCSNAAVAVHVLATAFLAAVYVLALLASTQPVLVSDHAVSAELHCRSPAGPVLSACVSERVLRNPDLVQRKVQACFWMLRMPFVEWQAAAHYSCRCLKPRCSHRVFCLAVKHVLCFVRCHLHESFRHYQVAFWAFRPGHGAWSALLL